MPQIAIAGAGPTGTTLALLLAQRGISVTLIEAANDFRRVFRGEGLMPSGLDALEQMGLFSLLNKVPHRQLDAWEITLGRKPLFRVAEPMEANAYPCTLVSQPPLLETLIAQARTYPEFNFIQGVPVKALLQDEERVTGVQLGDGREITAELVIGADGRNSVVRQRAGLKLDQQPKNWDVLWFKLADSARFVEDNVFHAVANGDRSFAIFHGAEEGKLHLAWLLSTDERAERQPEEWIECFASISPPWLAKHFYTHASTLERPIKLSVVVGCCPRWHCPGVLLLGDAAHPMAPIRAQGINVALRDVIVVANYLVPLFHRGAPHGEIDAVLSRIQAEREPEIFRAQKLQAEEGKQSEKLPKHPALRSLAIQVARLFRQQVRSSWVKRQREMRNGVTKVKLEV
ncbi:MAG: FAD-dependent monooxygenase [Cyanobacteriota bacterium]|nr:FAD-dependent monooxygenase [Cyanobacteriota bacterium]